MNILFLTDFDHSTTGGTQTSVNAQFNELTRQGHTVIMLCPSDEAPWQEIGHNIYSLPTLRLFKPGGYAVIDPVRASVRRIIKFIQTFGVFDIVHSHTDGQLAQRARTVADRLDVPLVQTMHGKDDVFFENSIRFSGLASSMLRAADAIATHRWVTPQGKHSSLTVKNLWAVMANRCAAADAVTVPSQHFTDLFIANGVPSEKLHVISNGLADAVFDELSQPSTTLHSPLSLIWASRLSPEKRPLEFLAAVRQLSIPVEVHMYGDGPLVETARQFVKKHELSNVTIHGRYQQKDITNLMQQHDLFVHTSYGFDNQPMVIMEAIAAGTPVFYCDPNLEEMMPQGVSVLSADPSSEGIAQTLTKTLSDTEKLRAMREAVWQGRDALRQSHQTKEMITLYESCTIEYAR